MYVRVELWSVSSWYSTAPGFEQPNPKKSMYVWYVAFFLHQTRWLPIIIIPILSIVIIYLLFQPIQAHDMYWKFLKILVDPARSLGGK